MSDQVKVALIVIAVFIIGAGAFTYGALTAPRPVKPIATISPKPTTATNTDNKLEIQQPIISGILIAKYPKISTDYIINQGKLYNNGAWYGTTLTYKGSDSDNRDTLRVLFQKKNGSWTLRTTPPQPLLSTSDYADVPKSILQDINKSISLPAATTSGA